MLGAGAQGKIVAAFDHKKREQVAIKVYTSIGVFYKEKKAFKILKKRKVSNLCEVFKWTKGPNNSKMSIMKRYQSDMYEYITKQNSCFMSEPASKQLFLQICLIVRDVHKAGIAHLDLKLENFLIDDRQQPILSDFGNCFIENKKYAGYGMEL